MGVAIRTAVPEHRQDETIAEIAGARLGVIWLPATDLYLMGRQDEMNPIEQAGLLLRLNPRARLEIFDRCRMMPQEEHAERFNALLREAFRAGIV